MSSCPSQAPDKSLQPGRVGQWLCLAKQGSEEPSTPLWIGHVLSSRGPLQARQQVLMHAKFADDMLFTGVNVTINRSQCCELLSRICREIIQSTWQTHPPLSGVLSG